MQHRSAPDDGLVSRDEHADRDDLHAVGQRRQDHVVDLGRVAFDAEHAGHREAIDVGVHDTDPQAVLGHGSSQVDGHRGLADTALARSHAVDPGQAVRLGEGDLTLRVVAAQGGAKLRALLVAHDPQGHVDTGDSLDSQERGSGVLGEGVLERAARDRQQNRDGGTPGVVDRDRLDHAELGDGLADLGVDDLGEGGEEGVLRWNWHDSMLGQPGALESRGRRIAGQERPAVRRSLHAALLHLVEQ